MELRKSFIEILPSPCLSTPLCVYVCTIIIHNICEWHAEAWGVCGGGGGVGELSTAKKRVGYLHHLYLKYRLKSFKKDCIISATVVSTLI